jgi:hypothetical protein
MRSTRRRSAAAAALAVMVMTAEVMAEKTNTDSHRRRKPFKSETIMACLDSLEKVDDHSLKWRCFLRDERAAQAEKSSSAESPAALAMPKVFLDKVKEQTLYNDTMQGNFKEKHSNSSNNNNNNKTLAGERRPRLLGLQPVRANANVALTLFFSPQTSLNILMNRITAVSIMKSKFI